MGWTPRRTYVTHLHYAIQNGYYVGTHSGKTVCGTRVQAKEFTVLTKECTCGDCKDMWKEYQKIRKRVSRFRGITWRQD
jgi:hypothetical protein